MFFYLFIHFGYLLKEEEKNYSMEVEEFQMKKNSKISYGLVQHYACYTLLHIRSGKMINIRMPFPISLSKRALRTPTGSVSHLDGSDERSRHTSLLKKKKEKTHKKNITDLSSKPHIKFY